ncbi:MAG: hypothetical protein LBC75_02570 [Fibromonadaceae bacterium]|jgi:hypothetical protein|nr:hypothetical protein [Fibromonadaceae bacterium]
MTKGDKITLLADLAFKVNHLAESFSESEEAIRKAIKEESLLEFLHKQRDKDKPSLINDFSYYTKEQKSYLNDMLENVDNCYIKEDCGVESNGYNLLVAFALMGIQTECSE